MREKENKLRSRRWQSRGCAKLKQQASNPAQIASHGLHLHLYLRLLFYFFFLLLFLLLLFLLSISIIVVSVSHLLSICVCADSFVFFLCFQGPFTWLTLGKKKTFNFWIKGGKMFQPLDFCSWARDVTIDRLICDKHLITFNPPVNTKEKSNWVKQK